MKAWVTMRVEGRFSCEVDVPEGASAEDIRKKADALFGEADFGELADIDGEAVTWTDENDRMHDFNIISGSNC